MLNPIPVVPLHPVDLFAGAGAVRALLREFDWAGSPLGHPDNWPIEMRVSVRQLLGSQFPMWLAWGSELNMIYNDAYSDILLDKHPRALGQPVLDVWNEIRAQIIPMFDQALAGIATPLLMVQFDILRANALEPVWFNFALTPFYMDNGEVGGVSCIITETTSVVKERETIQHLNQLLEQRAVSSELERDRLWHLTTDIMLVANFQAEIVAVNPAWSVTLGRSEADSLGLDFMQFVHPDDREATLAEVDKLARGIKTLRFENRYRHSDGSYRSISWTAVPDEAMLHAIGRDVSEERAGAEALLQSQTALLQSQKMESIGKLTGGVAHDFNNVLQIISGNLQLLQLSTGRNAESQKRIENAASAVDRGAKLASQLLAFARRQPLKPLVTDVGRLLRDMDDLLRRAIGETIDIQMSVGGGLWNTLVDPHQLENVLLNLAINARDAMDGIGKLTLELGNSTLDDYYASEHSGVVPGQYVMLAVSDTGGGIAKDVMGKIFDPFFTTKREGEGTGLGLSMAYGFVKQSGGHIKVYSEVGHGTTFKIYLPRSHELVADLPVILSGPVLGGTETILVVEDDLHVQATVVDILRGLGYAVLKASDGLSAMAVISSGVPIDLLFTDVVMPGELRSPEMARQAKALIPNLAVLFTSGYTQNAIVHGGRLDPGVELLSKPYLAEHLARKIRHLLANRDHAAGLNRFRATLVPQVPVEQVPPPVRRILLVEDNDDARGLTAELLGLLGHQVSAVGTAEQAIAALGDDQFDILLTDVTLPRMSGADLALMTMQTYPEMEIIFSTGHSPQSLAPELQAHKFLIKPFTMSQLEGILLPALG
ncbi:MAG: response regulator [Pseudomonadota bacterium]